MWQKVYEEQQTNPLPPKAEWAYINFVQRFIAINPHVTKTEIITAWHHERKKHLAHVQQILQISLSI